MAFVPSRKVDDSDVKAFVIANSQTIAVGDAVIPAATTHAGAVTGAANTTGIILGVVRAILNPLGKPLEVNSYAVASNNETVGGILAEITPCYIDLEYLADLSQVSGTTTSSNLMGQFNLSTSVNGQLDETSYGVFSTQKQFFSFGANPQNASQVYGKFSTTKVV